MSNSLTNDICGLKNKNYVGSEVLMAANMSLMMEAASTSETLVNFYQTTWHYNPEDSHLHASINI
jgi:hypothetical protein